VGGCLRRLVRLLAGLLRLLSLDGLVPTQDLLDGVHSRLDRVTGSNYYNNN